MNISRKRNLKILNIYTVKVDHSEVLRVPLTVIAGSQLKRTGGLLSTLIS